MKQVIRKGLKEIIVDEVPDPQLGAHHVLVRPLASLISSGTETASIHAGGVAKAVAENPSHISKVLNVMKTNHPVATLREVLAKFSEYAVLGYSGAGIIAAKHATVDDLEVGDRVAYGGEGTGHGETILAGQNLVAKVPAKVPFEHACFTTLGAIALNSIRTAGIGVGDVVAVMGVGLVGQLVAQLARLQGAVVIAIDLKQERLDLAKQLGADYGLLGDGSLAEKVKALTDGRGADCVIIAAAAKSPLPCQQALQVCRDRGRLVIVGAVEIELPWHEMYMKEIQLFMSRAYGPGSYDSEYEKRGRDYPITYVRWTERRNMEEILRLLAVGRLNVQPLITHEFQLEDAAQAYQTIMNPATNSLAVVLRYPAAHGDAGTIDFKPVRKVEVTPRLAKTSNEIRAALIGAGNLARWAHLPALQKTPNAALQAVYSTNGARGKSYARRFKASYCTSDFDEVLRDANVDLCLILSRNQEHARQTVAALRAGKHVFVEKPMALTLAECREIYQAVEASGRQLTVGFNRRFAPFYLELKQALQKRTSPVVMNCRINSPGISGDYWMADPSIGGAILGEACHFVDLMYWLVEAEPVSVMAYSLPTDRRDPVGANNLTATFKFADGSIGNLTYCTVGSKTSGGERVEVFAQGVGAMCEDFKQFQLKTGSISSKAKWWAEKGYDAQMRAFIQALRTGQAPAVTVRDGARATLGCLQMLEAARTGQPCALNVDAALLAPPAAGIEESTANAERKAYTHSVG
jgi:predicted dehydrogenase/threonine dehydrogenase-like Zn-dependent dehydrogenase